MRTGWKQEGKMEHRWITPDGVRIDLLSGAIGVSRQTFSIQGSTKILSVRILLGGI
jgi:hypothetical protein